MCMTKLICIGSLQINVALHWCVLVTVGDRVRVCDYVHMCVLPG